jgi:hypothetical protein
MEEVISHVRIGKVTKHQGLVHAYLTPGPAIACFPAGGAGSVRGRGHGALCLFAAHSACPANSLVSCA